MAEWNDVPDNSKNSLLAVVRVARLHVETARRKLFALLDDKTDKSKLAYLVVCILGGGRIE